MDLGARVAGLASLNEPVRRNLYRYVVAQDGPVSRDAASEGVGVARHTAKFHLDRLVEDGLLAAEYQRLTNRSGPGAGRPAKLYRRSDRELSVTLPERRYELVGELMAVAMETSIRDGVPVGQALRPAAQHVAERLVGAEPWADRPGSGRSDLTKMLEAHGYEPRERGAAVELANCPFDRLAQEHTALVCGMNLALLTAVTEQMTQGQLVARLDPAPNRCCVVLGPVDDGEVAEAGV